MGISGSHSTSVNKCAKHTQHRGVWMYAPVFEKKLHSEIEVGNTFD